MVQATETTTLEHDIQTPDTYDTSTGELVLRVCSSARQGQIVRLRSRKCTIGSSSNCTLRLNARGVHPLHCLIVRGPNATVIRSSAIDTRLNGRSFTDANLNFGDRLMIGPIEFEVLNANTFPIPAESETDQNFPQWQVENDAKQQQLSQAADELDSKTVELEKQKAALQQQQKQLETQTQKLNQKQDRLDRQTIELRQDREQLDTEVHTLRQHRERLDTETETLRRNRERVDSEAENLRQQREQLESETETLRQDREQLNAETETLRQDREPLNPETETLRQDRERLDAETETLRKNREQLDAETETLRHEREQLDAETETLRQDRERLESETETLGKEREAWESDRGEADSQSPENDSLLEQEQRELEAKRAELERQAEQWRNEHELEQQRLRQEGEAIESQTVELEKQNQILQRQRQEWDTQQQENEQRLREQSEDIDRREASLMDQSMELDEARTAWETQKQDERGQWEREKQLALEHRQQTEEVTVYEPQTSAEAPEDSPHEKELSTEAPVSLGDTLDRMGVSLVDDDEPLPEVQQQTDTSSKYEQQKRPEQAGDTDDEGEESLDSYMARLMDRARNVSDSSDSPAVSTPTPVKRPSAASRPASSRAKEVPTSPSQTAEILDDSQRTPEKKLESIEPRGVAPEREMSLSSMRELANVSAHTAINRHAKRQYRHTARSKLLVSGISLAAGTILMSIWWMTSDRGPFFHAAMVAFMIALFWGFQFAIMSGKVLATNMDAERLAQIMSDDEDHGGNDEQETPPDHSV